MTILLTGTRAPATLDLARRLWREGVRVIGADSMHYPLGRFSNAFAAHYHLPSPRKDRRGFLSSILRIVDLESVDLIWPTCEEIFHLAGAYRELSPRVTLLCSPLDVLEPLHHKLKFSRLAGVHAPGSWLPIEAPRDRRLVWKPCYSRFATRTRMDSPPPSLGGWMAQEWVSGGEFSSWAWCMSGEVRTITFYECPVRAGRGAGCAFAPIWEEAAAGFVSEMARALRFTGSLAFDFIRPEPGQFKVIECNPRLTSGLHVLDPAIQLSDLLRNPGPIPPPMQSALLRLPTFLSKPALAWSSPDVTSATDDPGPAWGQVIGIAEFAGIAMRNRVSLSAATTLDIEYNGE